MGAAARGTVSKAKALQAAQHKALAAAPPPPPAAAAAARPTAGKRSLEALGQLGSTGKQKRARGGDAGVAAAAAAAGAGGRPTAGGGWRGARKEPAALDASLEPSEPGDEPQPLSIHHLLQAAQRRQAHGTPAEERCAA